MVDAPHDIRDRPYRGDDDFRRVRDLLVTTFPVAPPGHNWETRRWDGWRHYEEPGLPPPADPTHLWETVEGSLVGAVHPDAGHDPVFQIHPDHRHIEEAMIEFAERRFSPDSSGRITTHVMAYDVSRMRSLRARGWIPGDEGEVTYRMRLGDRLPDAPVVSRPFELRHIRSEEPDDCDRLAALLNAAFGRTIHTGAGFAGFAANAPGYRDDLHLVAIAPDHTFAAHVGFNYDPVNGHAVVEPVCTHPDWRGRGLARALIGEGLTRVARLGARSAEVGTGTGSAARALYEAAGFTEVYEGRFWQLGPSAGGSPQG